MPLSSTDTNGVAELVEKLRAHDPAIVRAGVSIAQGMKTLPDEVVDALQYQMQRAHPDHWDGVFPDQDIYDLLEKHGHTGEAFDPVTFFGDSVEGYYPDDVSVDGYLNEGDIPPANETEQLSVEDVRRKFDEWRTPLTRAELKLLWESDVVPCVSGGRITRRGNMLILVLAHLVSFKDVNPRNRINICERMLQTKIFRPEYDASLMRLAFEDADERVRIAATKALAVWPEERWAAPASYVNPDEERPD